MKTIIAGSRHITDYKAVDNAIKESGFSLTEVVCGGCSGVDSIGRVLAHGALIPVKMFSADWKAHGKSAGPIRNSQMAEYAEALIAVWDGNSRGTQNMINTARAKGLKVFVKII